MRQRIWFWATLALICVISGQTSAIERVAARMGYMEVSSSYAMPLGSYNGIPGMPFEFDAGSTFSYDANRVYNDGFGVGLTFGKAYISNWRIAVGFDYARNKIKNPISQAGGLYEYTIAFMDDPTYHQSDVKLHCAYAPLNLTESYWTPFVGLGASLGLGSVSTPGYQTDYQFNTSLAADFGLDVKLWTAPDKRSFVTFSSINSWTFVATGDRIKHLQVGGGLRYFFKS